ncbi:MAG: D-hexose-6-phosphate mutarotase [Aeromonadaceae bacterium]
MITHLQLDTLRQLTDTTRLARNEHGVEFLIVERPEGEALITLLGAQLLHFAPKNQPKWLWLSETSKFDGSRGIRGGIPLCWPWFGPSPERVGLGKPQHGFARTSTWQLDGISETGENTLIHLSLCASDATREIWPHEFELEMDILLGDSVTLLLTSRNSGTTPWTYSGALHSYFEIAKPEEVRVSGLGERFIDKLDGSAIKPGGLFTLDQAVDRIYDRADEVITLERGYPTLTLHNHNADSVVVWTPWLGGANMPDFDDDGWRSMLCVETAITSPTGVTLAPEEEHSLCVRIEAVN